MQVIAAGAATTRATRIAVVRSAATALLLLLAGGLLAWLCVGTPLMAGFLPEGRPSATQVATGALAWGLAVLVPAGLLLIGVARVASTFEALADLRPRKMTPRLAKALGPDHIAATDLVLPGGRRIHELVLGPFGIVVLGDVPPSSVSRHVGSGWEIRDGRGRWVPMEGPLERASRDAERIRGWLATDERDFLVRVYAAVVTADPRVERTASCAVVPPADLAGWLEALPRQRGLTAERREQLMAMIRTVAAGR
jgi:hypothetical protein